MDANDAVSHSEVSATPTSRRVSSTCCTIGLGKGGGGRLKPVSVCRPRLGRKLTPYAAKIWCIKSETREVIAALSCLLSL